MDGVRRTSGGPERDSLASKMVTRVVPTARYKSKKDAGRWAWGAWF